MCIRDSSYVSAYFKDNVDIYFARRLVSEKLLEAKERIPEGYGEPTLGPVSYRHLDVYKRQFQVLPVFNGLRLLCR